MIETKFTKGEWSIAAIPPNGCIPVGTNGLMVCITAHSIREPEQKEEAKANAHLIAAAPEMYEENERRATLLGEVYTSLLQEDYATAFKLIHDSETIDFSSGKPVAVSPSLNKARGEV